MKTFHWLDYLTHLELLALIIALLMVSYPSESNELYLGLKTYHFDRKSSSCLNESHDLIAYEHKSFYIGTYNNTQCNQSYLIGHSYTHKSGLGVDVSAVSGYPKRMQMIDKLVIIPSITYKIYTPTGLGIKFMYIPTVLVGVNTAYDFDLMKAFF